MPTQIATDGALLERLKHAASVPVTGRQMRSQRISFIYGNLPKESTITRSQIEDELDRISGEPEHA